MVNSGRSDEGMAKIGVGCRGLSAETEKLSCRREKVLSFKRSVKLRKMQRERVLNFAAIILFIAFIALFSFRLLHPSPFVLNLKAKLKGFHECLTFSPKGDLLAALRIGYPEGLVVGLWQVPSGQSAHFIVVTRAPSIGITPNSLTFSFDGRFLAVGYQENGVNKVSVFNLADGRKVQTIVMGKSSNPPSVTFAPDGRLAIIYGERLWFAWVESGERIQTKIQALRVTFSPDGRFIVAWRGNEVNIFDGKGQMIRKLKVRKASIRFIDELIFSRDGQKLVCFWHDRKQVGQVFQERWWFSIWGTKDWRLERSKPLTQFQTSTQLSGINLKLVAFLENSLIGWHGLLWRLKRSFEPVLSRLLRSPVVFSGPPSRVLVYRLEDGKLVAKSPWFKYADNAAFSPDGRYLAVSCEGGITLWELKGRGK